MTHLNKFPAIKEHICSKAKLKIRNVTKENLAEKNVEAFLKSFFVNYNKNNPTVYVSNGAIQTQHNLRRSIGDIFLICQHYFPRTSLKKTYERLCALVNEGVVVSAICDDINKRVYRLKTDYDKSNFFNGDLTDEYGIDFTMFNLDNITNNEHGWGIDYTVENLEIINL